ncbi:MAG TPA: class I tRNA ligase family protein [Pirellulaceae bacterium]|jgi:leucyl-tRNA synthetase
MPRYSPATIEPKWQRYWEENKTFKTPEMPPEGKHSEKLYVLDMFPYPSGAGLHVGHPEGYTATDIVCRFARMNGKTVLHPMGFDAFGLPAEEHAIKTNTPPRVNTEQNIATFRRQLKMLGFSYDWDRELATTDVEYFRWTQWIFLVLFDTWFDAERQKGRPICELPIPVEVKAQGDKAVRKYQDEHRLAYQSDALVNWCPGLGTVVANEEVIDGKSERGGHPVVRMPLRQWMLRITAYADRLEKDLEPLDWPEGIKKLQRDWIGRSVGAEVDFWVEGRGSGLGARSSETEFEEWKAERVKSGYPKKAPEDVLRIYTTRPDTLFGATYMVIAPEHPVVQRLTTAEQKSAVEKYVQAAASKSDRERQEVTKAKTGVFTGSYAINPVNGQPVPIWVADYVLWGYGTGAIMAVPAHDERDFEFAQQFGLPVIAVVDPGDSEPVDRQAVLAGKQCSTEDGVSINSNCYNGLTTGDFKKRITADLAKARVGREAVNYKLRDWLFSRQRFWGEPFPILHELDERGQPTGVIRAVDAKDLPVDLPHLDDYRPKAVATNDGTRSVPTTGPEPPLERAPDDWRFVRLPEVSVDHSPLTSYEGRNATEGVPYSTSAKLGETVRLVRYKRETNTMPQWAGSCWYFLRFIDPRNNERFVDPAKEKAWMPIDLYVGGAEHAVLHLLYSRFWHKVLFDRGHVSTAEPFRKLVNQGMILGENGEKMSKARGNVINPDDVVKEHGADSLRLFEMFMGPLEAVKPWSTAGVVGVRGFLDRAWRLMVDDRAEELKLNEAVQVVAPTDEANRVLHKTIKQVTNDIQQLQFNTGIARMMEFTNYFTKQSVRPRSVMEKFVLILAPFAPHIAEELWRLLGHDSTLAYEPWPVYDEALTKDAEVEIPVQILGKLRGKVVVPAGSDQAAIVAAALDDERIASLLAGKEVVKTIVVPGKLVNFVVK